jgi:uncharacterized membrane protein YphA (DoxX/SURF4 family)
LNLLARILLGAIFVVSSISKLSSIEGFELYLFSFGFAGFDLCSVAARLLIAAEFLLGIFLIFNICFKLTRGLTLFSLLSFSLFLLWRYAIGDTESCHCMGELIDLNPMQSLLKNCVMGVLLALAWKPRTGSLQRQSLIATIIAAASFAAVFIVWPPDFYYRGGEGSHDLSMEKFAPVADSLDLSSGRRVVCFYSGSCDHCRNCASKMAGIIRRHSLPTDQISVLFMQTHADQDSVAVSFFNDSGNGLSLPYRYLHPVEFLPLTSGSMPIVVLLEDGNFVKEYDYTTLDESEVRDFLLGTTR